MLSIYNETKTPWTAEPMNEAVIRFSKEKSVKPKPDAEDQRPKTRAVSIITHLSLFSNLEDTRSKFGNVVESKSPAQISDMKSSVIFNHKAFQPFFTDRDENYKDLLLGSINLKGRLVTNVTNNQTFLLEVFTIGGELSFIASLNEIGSTLAFELTDKTANKITTYTFKRTESSVILNKNIYNSDKPAGEPVNGVHITKFRPSRPTHAILVDPKDKEALSSIIDPERHYVLDYNKHNAAEVIATLKDQHYRAVTVFANIPSENVSDAKAFGRYKRVSDALLPEFRTVVKLFSDNRTKKLKF